jgi:REP element-mobilizing transposase RayT
MPTKKIKTQLVAGKFFHVYNRGNDGEKLFYTHANRRFFIRKYEELLSPYVNTHAYCLLGNHFHFLFQTQENDDPVFHLRVSHQFRKLFQSYALAINKQEGREGSLFRKYFRRIQVKDMDYLKHLVFYIHFNPQKHLLVQDFRAYPYSSFSTYEKQESGGFLDVKSTLSWFNDYEDFLHYHDVMHDERKYKSVLLEDD